MSMSRMFEELFMHHRQLPAIHLSLHHRIAALVLASLICVAVPFTAAADNIGEPEKDELRFGFIKLTDMAPLAVAYENGYFEDEGLYVTL